ncbi:DUF5937 family protein [Streptomyces sp. NPDC001380]|uniref:DUF5937 family protein n=1 Tax=Streptomyces sp. NPDC001380 TaxID=3364566 RepID=UPI0036A58F23
MLAIEVGPVDVARTRFAVPPLGEAVQALRVAAGVQVGGPLRPWAERIAPRYERLREQVPAVGALTALFRRGAYNADFIHPPPPSGSGGFAAELAAVRAPPLHRARLELARNPAGLPTPPRQVQRILGAPDVVARLADALEASWQALVEPHWPRLRAVLERDLVRRAGHLAAGGWAAALGDLDPRVHWRAEGRSGTIEVRTGPRAAWDRRRPDGEGLLLMPTVFGTLISYVEPPWRYALVYPARGVADLLGPGGAHTGRRGPGPAGRPAPRAGAAGAGRARDDDAAGRPPRPEPGHRRQPPGGPARRRPGHPHPHRPVRPLRPHTPGRSPGRGLTTAGRPAGPPETDT